jgi:hypothetical protein
VADGARRKRRQLIHLSNRGDLNTFDVTPDGKHLVFDRSRQNSDIVLIDRPKKEMHNRRASGSDARLEKEVDRAIRRGGIDAQRRG